ncbi:hypothetical protein Aes012_087 [Aeromonas phage Aes012]|jgi:hypothetical protein|uniref:Putative phage protein n=1 Tax=Aeromonas phage Aes012 TaxID=1198014 RepID=I6ZRC3_9CAUD|nr:hypothetical protein Aes012_087 [Aeromonas phage Aes012]AFN69717.1 putative phage protein [Aeromonas phage Aes012]UYD57748.1 hypothetical protein MEIMHGIN_00106 [Aeromonas phage avDM3]
MSIHQEIDKLSKQIGVEASEFKISPIWKIVRKPEWSYGLSFEREFTVYEHKEMGYTIAIHSERHRAQFVNEDNEDVMGFAEMIVSVSEVEPHKSKHGTRWQFV